MIIIWDRLHNALDISDNSVIGLEINKMPPESVPVESIFATYLDDCYLAQVWNGEGFVFKTIDRVKSSALSKAIDQYAKTNRGMH